MAKPKIKTAKNPKDTEKIAQELLLEMFKNRSQKRALVVGLSGNLGAGKTTFVKAIAKHLGVKEKVSSPTFVIMKKYPLKKTNEHKFLFHLDAYRLKNKEELLVLGWGEIIGNEENLVFIEWPENVSEVIPKDAKMVYISGNEGDERYFKLNK